MVRRLSNLVLVLVLAIAIAFGSVLMQQQTTNAAWLAGWDYRIEMQIDYTGGIGASVTWFPVTIYLKAANGDTEDIFTEVGANSRKIAVTEADGTTELYVEVESWDDATDTAVLHTSLDGWTINADTSIYLYFDNDHADNAKVGIDFGDHPAHEVWNTDYQGVWHTENVQDSTSLGSRDLTDYNTVTWGAGKIDGAVDCERDNNEYLGLDGTNPIGPAGDYSITVEGWTKIETVQDAGYGAVVTERGGVSGAQPRYTIWQHVNKLQFTWVNSSINVYTKDITAAATGTWYYCVGTHDKDADVLRTFLNGADVGGTTATTGQMYGVGSGASYRYFLIGSYYQAVTYTNDGFQEEVRISDIERSDAWIKGTYSTLNDTLLTYGTTEEEGTIPTVETQTATNVEETTAYLQGAITATGDLEVTIRGFEWDIDSGAPYANDWHEHGSFGVADFEYSGGVYDQGECYYYRAYATNAKGTGYGIEFKFLTKPNAPTLFTANVTLCSQINMGWTPGTFSDNTVIMARQGTYPTSWWADPLATRIYDDTGTFYNHTGLSGGQSWYYRTWAWVTDGGLAQYSDTYAQDWDTTYSSTPPTAFTAVRVGTSDNVTLTWTPAVGTENVTIRREVNSYPTSVTDGELVYSGNVTPFVDTATSLDETVYYWAAFGLNSCNETSADYIGATIGGEGMTNAILLIPILGFGVALMVVGYWRKKWPIIVLAALMWGGAGFWSFTNINTAYDIWFFLGAVCVGMALLSATEPWWWGSEADQAAKEPSPEEKLEQANAKALGPFNAARRNMSRRRMD